MAQTNFTPILTYKSDTATVVPSAGNLTNSANGAELAVNTADKRLFTKDSGGNVVELGTNPSSVTLPNGTANGVVYANGSKVLTTGSALTFDGTNLGVNLTNPIDFWGKFGVGGNIAQSLGGLHYFWDPSNTFGWNIGNPGNSLAFSNFGGSEQMRLTSTGLGIGTSSPNARLAVVGGGIRVNGYSSNSSGDGVNVQIGTTGGVNYLQSLNGTGTNNLSIDANQVTFRTGSYTTAATLDSSGNLGLGVTPSTWSSTYRVIQLPSSTYGGGSFFTDAGSPAIAANAYNNSGWKYVNNDYATIYQSRSGQHQWFTAASGTAGNAISFTQAMTLDASGNLGLGTTSPLSYSGKFIEVSNATSAGLKLTAGTSGLSLGADFSYIASDKSLRITTYESTGFIRFNTQDTERARIDSSGNLLVGTTSVYDNSRFTLETSSAQPNGIAVKTFGNNNAIGFWRNSTTYAGAITLSGSGTAYTSASDYRLKHDIAPMTGALAKVALLKPVTYKWNADGSDGQGFIAHELQAVVPDCVTGEKDAVDADGNPQYQGIDTSFLVATLTAAIQEQQAIITALTARVAALESN